MRKTFLFLLAFWVCQPVYAALAKNVVTGVQGDAKIVRSGQDQPAAMGMEVSQGDHLKTAENCQIDVSLHGSSGVRILASSEAVLKQVDAASTWIELKTGNMIANLKKKIPEGAKFEVETPTAVLAVRGTQFWGQVTAPGEKPKTVFAVREGVLNVKDKATAEEWMLNPGQAIEITGDGQPALTRNAAAAELDAIAHSEQIKI